MISSGTTGYAGAVGVSASVGAIMGSILSGGYFGALAGGVTGAASSALTASTVLSGPVGFLVVGAEDNSEVGITFDCWKPILHDETSEPSRGRLMKDVVADPRIKDVQVWEDGEGGALPRIALKNIWNEDFCIEYVSLSPEKIAAHAKRVL